MVLLALSGLASGMISSVSTYPTGQANDLSPGFVFGFVLVLCLAFPAILNGPLKGLLKAVAMIVVSVAAYFFSFQAAVGLQLVSPQMVASGELNHERPSPVALCFGGFVGGLIVFSAAMLLLAPRISRTILIRRTLLGAAIGGALGVAGWALRSSVGIAVWHLLHHFQLTPGWQHSPWDAEWPDPALLYSLYVVWQTGIAIALGVTLPPFPNLTPRHM
jgi:hypothetical protein